MAQGWRYFPYCKVIDFHDGDTCEVEVDSGFGAYHRVSVRVYGISAPEVRGAEKDAGLEALKRARDIAWGCDAELWTWKQSFTRYVGRIRLANLGIDFAEAMVSTGLVRAWDGKTERPLFPVPTDGKQRELELYRAILERDFMRSLGR